MFCNIDGEENIAVAGVEALLEQRVAGMVALAFISRTDRLEDALKRAAVPIVFLGLSEPWGDSVGPQNTQGGRLATEHLLAVGHRRIAYVRTPLVDSGGDQARYRGYRAAMRKARAGASAALEWEPGEESVSVGKTRHALPDLLRRPNATTALFVSNDIGAIAMIDACETFGFDIPGDVSIVGFDDITFAGLHRISLTTVAQSLELQAERAVGLLLERIENPDIPPRHEGVSVTLKVRDSTAPPQR
jgi:LacI family transcriptional regulator